MPSSSSSPLRGQSEEPDLLRARRAPSGDPRARSLGPAPDSRREAKRARLQQQLDRLTQQEQSEEDREEDTSAALTATPPPPQHPQQPEARNPNRALINEHVNPYQEFPSLR